MYIYTCIHIYKVYGGLRQMQYSSSNELWLFAFGAANVALGLPLDGAWSQVCTHTLCVVPGLHTSMGPGPRSAPIRYVENKNTQNTQINLNK